VNQSALFKNSQLDESD